MIRLLPAAVDGWAAREPERLAVVDDGPGPGLTYGVLGHRAAQLAGLLTSAGVGAETVVGVAMHRGAALPVAVVAVLRAGGCHLPVDVDDPRSAEFLAEAGASLVLTQPHLAERVRAITGQPVLEVDDRLTALDGLPVAGSVAVRPEQAAYVLFTSGSSGRPKGVVVEHRAIANQVAWSQDDHHLTAGDRMLHHTATTFDVSISELLWTLAVGATVVLAAPGGHKDADYLVAVMARQRVTVVQLVPSMLAVLVDHESFADLPALRLVISGGEALDPVLADRFFARHPRCELANRYGPTETAVDVLAWMCRPGGDVPIGHPGPGTTAHVLDDRLAPVPPGTPGELCVGGVQLARGYLGAPALTAERFVPNPFTPGERLYRTGDLVRERPDGALSYLGRVDQQVKLRGLRVEPSEVEAALLGHPDVGVAAVVPVTRAGETRLAAYVVPRAGTEPSAAALRAHLAARVPEHLVPAYLTTLPELPRLPSGKVDRAALPEPATAATPTGDGLHGLVAELLGAEVGEHEDFFAAGGHSLLATRLVGLARTRLGLRFTVTDVFERRTVAGLLAVAERDDRPAPEPPVRVPRDRPLPVGLVQERVWFLQKLVPGSAAYQYQFGIRWRGDLDVPRLAAALTAIVRRHEILRTTFTEIDGELRQVIHPPFPVELPVVEHAPAGEIDAFVRDRLDPGELPLVRWRLYRLDDGDHLLVQVEHHFVHDGWSLGVFLRELTQHYRGEVLPELPLQFADIAAWQRRRHAAGHHAQDVAYFVERLRGAPPLLELPLDRPRPPRPTHAGDACSVPLDGPLFHALRDLAVRHGATPFMVMLAAFEVLLHRYTAATDMVVATGVAGRTPETEPLIGMFVNTVALRLDASGDPSFTVLLDRVRRVTEDAYAHQDAPFGDVVAALRLDRDLSVNPLSQVLFSFHDAAMPDLVLPGVRGELVDFANRTAKADLNVIVVARPEQRVGLHDVAGQDAYLWWEFSTDVVDRATVERMAGHYVALLRAIVATPDAAIGDLPLEAGSPARAVPAVTDPGPPVAELVARHATTRPDAVAVSGPAGETLTFAELAAAVTATAAALVAEGVRADTPVAVALHRTPDWIVALLAVLRAGGAFVPLDPAQPAARRERILADSGATVGITVDAPLGTDVRWLRPGARAAAALPEVAPEQLAYVLYTSGSTGEPRGVAVTHRGLANLVRWHRRAYDLGPGERVSHLAGLGFDAIVEEIFPALAAGATVHLAPDEARATAPAVRDWLCAQGITVAFVATPVAELLFGLDWPAGYALRHLMTGGDRLTRRPPAGLPFTVTNQYGPTENTVVATAGPVSPDGAGLPDIGTAIDGVGTLVLDARLRPVPAGVPGELCLTGESLARGYHGRPDATRAAFTTVDGVRVYRTGDRVRQRQDGTLEFLGRLDDQVKVRGVRIEPAEVEAALVAHPAVRAAAVLVHPDRKRLVGYLVPAAGPVDTRALADDLGRVLPSVMVPALWQQLDRLPLTANGKVDRAALPAPEEAPAGTDGPPDGPAEHRVASAFRVVLGVRVESRADNFFALGGHSLNAVKVVHELGGEITIADVFTKPTVAALAAALTPAGGHR
ncbi:amino acid adenylation domain-containing protein [Actinophytocola sp. KF-1]